MLEGGESGHLHLLTTVAPNSTMTQNHDTQQRVLWKKQKDGQDDKPVALQQNKKMVREGHNALILTFFIVNLNCEKLLKGVSFTWINLVKFWTYFWPQM